MSYAPSSLEKEMIDFFFGSPSDNFKNEDNRSTDPHQEEIGQRYVREINQNQSEGILRWNLNEDPNGNSIDFEVDFESIRTSQLFPLPTEIIMQPSQSTRKSNVYKFIFKQLKAYVNKNEAQILNSCTSTLHMTEIKSQECFRKLRKTLQSRQTRAHYHTTQHLQNAFGLKYKSILQPFLHNFFTVHLPCIVNSSKIKDKAGYMYIADNLYGEVSGLM